MTSRDFVPDGNYGSITAEAERRISNMERKGRPMEYAIHARLHRKALSSHVTADRTEGQPCVQCGQSWPCDAIAGIFAPD